MSEPGVAHALITPPRALTAAVRRLLRPLVKVLLHYSVQYPALASLLKLTYVEVMDTVLRERCLDRFAEQERPAADQDDVLQAVRCLDPLLHRRHGLLGDGLGQGQQALHVVRLLKDHRLLAGA